MVGRGENGLLCDPGSELRLGGREKRRARIILNAWDGKKKEGTLYHTYITLKQHKNILQYSNRVHSCTHYPVTSIYCTTRIMLYLPATGCATDARHERVARRRATRDSDAKYFEQHTSTPGTRYIRSNKHNTWYDNLL